MDSSKLFSPGHIGRCETKNRIIMAPMGNINMADTTGRPLPKMIEYFRERARGGTGLIITGLVPIAYGIDPTISEANNTTIFPRIDGGARPQLVGWRDLAAAVHAYDTRLFIQLTAGLGRVGSPETALQGKIPKSASFNRNFYVPQVPHFPLSDRAIKKIIKSFGQSAVNAKVSGIDGVQLHGHEGYLLDQLTSRPWNRRKWGRYRNRWQFALDVVGEIKARCGSRFPIIYRVDLTQGLCEAYGEKTLKQRFHGSERTIEEGIEFCLALAEAGVDAFDVDKGCYDNWFFPHPPAYFEDMPYVEEIAGRLKKEFALRSIDAAVIAVGKMGKPEVAAAVLEQGWADYIMLGRPLLADPYWPKKVKQGKPQNIIHCIGDQEGCIQSFILGGHPCCAVNPYTGFEDCKQAVPALQIKRVAVVGAGPAGCEAAKTAFLRGHQVTLFEKADQVGGQLRLTAKMKFKHDVARYLENLQYQMDELAARGLQIHYGTKASLEDLQPYEVVICATGLKQSPILPAGIDNISSMDVRSFLGLPKIPLAEDLKRITIIGGGQVGCEAAYHLASQGYEVTILEQSPFLMAEVVTANRAMLLWLLMGFGVTRKGGEKLNQPVAAYTTVNNLDISPGKIRFNVNRKRPEVYTPWQPLIPENVHNPFAYKSGQQPTEMMEIATDFIILAYGSESDRELYYQLLSSNIPAVYRVGDCQSPGRVWEAVSAANEIARNI
ncbi:MAG: FAD-dependent oxidoreductase [Methylocystaceae bacterium]